MTANEAEKERSVALRQAGMADPNTGAKRLCGRPSNGLDQQRQTSPGPRR
jgi:hypothetical protein